MVLFRAALFLCSEKSVSSTSFLFRWVHYGDLNTGLSILVLWKEQLGVCAALNKRFDSALEPLMFRPSSINTSRYHSNLFQETNNYRGQIWIFMGLNFNINSIHNILPSIPVSLYNSRSLLVFISIFQYLRKLYMLHHHMVRNSLQYSGMTGLSLSTFQSNCGVQFALMVPKCEF